MSSFQIVTVVSTPEAVMPYHCYNQFLASIRRYGHEPLILSEGFGGIGTNPRLLKEAIDQGKITADYIIWTNAFDVVFADDPAKILEGYDNIWQQAIGGDVWHDPNDAPRIVWGGERNCWPDPLLAKKHSRTKYSFRYLNSGWSIGPTEAYSDALDEMNALEIRDDHLVDKKWVEFNDQLAWQLQLINGSVPMAVDSACELCQSLTDVLDDDLDFSELSKIRNTETNTYPMVFHFNGGSKEKWKDKILTHLKL